MDFAGNEKSMAFAMSVLARGGKIVVSGLMGGTFSVPQVQWVYERMTVEGFMTGTLQEAMELMGAGAVPGRLRHLPSRSEQWRTCSNGSMPCVPARLSGGSCW
ncbi:D-arabinose 1-dehydrogenase-like Zn-dependent alcohol dehydrogenase [Bradyrhizobium sp. USDA 4502]